MHTKGEVDNEADTSKRQAVFATIKPRGAEVSGCRKIMQREMIGVLEVPPVKMRGFTIKLIGTRAWLNSVNFTLDRLRAHHIALHVAMPQSLASGKRKCNRHLKPAEIVKSAYSHFGCSR